MIARDRHQMAQILSDRMTRTYTTLSERQELEPDTSLVKTYMVEAHLSASAEPSQAQNLARSAFSPAAFGKASHVKIYTSGEPTLLSVEATVKSEQVTIYVDFTNSRYWVLHSMASSDAADWMIDRLVSSGPDLDRAWLPADFLESISQLGSFRGLNLDYDRRVVPDVDFQSPHVPVEFLKMQLWGNKAGDVLEILRKKGAFPHETTLSKVKVKFSLDEATNEEFSLDDIKYDGKVTARGTSFLSHIGLVSRVYETYAEQIQNLEKKYALRRNTCGDRLSLEGSPINFLFDRPIANLEVFSQCLFSCGEPFRLWGVPLRLADDFFRVNAVDLHVGSPLQFEIAPDFMRVYLPTGSCGNTIVRLYTNLQHHYDSLVRAVDGDERNVFDF